MVPAALFDRFLFPAFVLVFSYLSPKVGIFGGKNCIRGACCSVTSSSLTRFRVASGFRVMNGNFRSSLFPPQWTRLINSLLGLGIDPERINPLGHARSKRPNDDFQTQNINLDSKANLHNNSICLHLDSSLKTDIRSCILISISISISVLIPYSITVCRCSWYIYIHTR